MAEKPVIARRTPCTLEVGPGTVYWCRCGRSKTQPCLRWIPLEDITNRYSPCVRQRHLISEDGSLMTTRESRGILIAGEKPTNS